LKAAWFGDSTLEPYIKMCVISWFPYFAFSNGATNLHRYDEDDREMFFMLQGAAQTYVGDGNPAGVAGGGVGGAGASSSKRKKKKRQRWGCTR
jgi:hypothetical protein